MLPLRTGDRISQAGWQKNYPQEQNPTFNVKLLLEKRDLTHCSSVIPLLILHEILQQCAMSSKLPTQKA